MKIFGGEPAWLLGGLQALLAALVAWDVFDLTQDQAGVLLTAAGALIGLITAFATRDTLVAAGVGLVNALVAAVAAWGFTFSQDQIAAVVGIVSVLLAAWQRKSTEPLASPTLKNGPAAGSRYPVAA